MSYLRLSFFLLLLLASSAIAEQTPKNFYPPKFVFERDGKTGEIVARRTDEISNQEVDESTRARLAPELNQHGFINDDSNEWGGIPIERMGLVVNADSVDHLKDTLQQLNKTAMEKNLTVGDVFIDGNLEGVFRDPESKERIAPEIFTLTVLGGKLRTVSEFEVADKVQNSPAWLVTTKDTVFVLDGASSLSSYLDEKGRFIDPKSASSRAITSEAF